MQAFNPYLPSWEYVPDGEPYVFGDRIYVYGSHDLYNGHVFCLGDYVCWSAPVSNLGDWRYEGIIYEKIQDPSNREGKMCLYAPDITVGPDGRYYLYYVLDKLSIVSVAVCDTPAGKYEFYGYVAYPDGSRLGDRLGDEAQFDPAVLTEGDVTYLYTGFCDPADKSRHGMMATVLEKDMLTVREEPVFVVPNQMEGSGTGFEGHEYFEAPSIRKVGKRYYLLYSSVAMHELCYAVSESPTKDFRYGGVVVSNCDMHIDTYKPALMQVAFAANNHGGIAEINEKWYIFYHRHTNGTWFSRQGCAEEIQFGEDGAIAQAEITSCGLNNGPLEGKGEYPSYIACHLFRLAKTENTFTGDRLPRIVQAGRDGDTDPAYITGIRDQTIIGFKYFLLKDVKQFRIKVRGYAGGRFEVRTRWDGPACATLPVEYANVWEEYTADISLPEGKCALYLAYLGEGEAELLSFTLK